MAPTEMVGRLLLKCCCSRAGRIIFGVLFVIIYGCYILYYNSRVTSDLVFIRSDSSLGCGTSDPKIVVLMDSLQNEALSTLGGTGHWFHFTEYLLPSLSDYENTVWDLSKHHDDLYIVFQEESSPKSIGGMGSIILASVVGGGRFDRVIVGYADTITFANNSDSVAVLDAFHEVFTVEKNLLAKPPVDANDAAAAAYADKQKNFMICSNIVYRHSWLRTARYEWFDKSFRLFIAFRKAVGSVCGLQFDKTLVNEKANHYSRAVPSGAIRSQVGIPDDMCDGKKRAFVQWNSENSSDLMLPAPIVDSKMVKKRIVLYQRDHSRVLTNADSVVRDISQLLAFSRNNASLITPKVLNSLRGASTTSSSSGELDMRRLGRRRLKSSKPATSNNWEVELMMHSSQRPPCELIKEMSTATVLITPHGFQSLLLLFQPLESLLVEIQPHLYVKPTVYGYVEAGFRLNMGLPRSYLYEESIPNFWMRMLIRLLELFGYGSWCNEEYCLHYAVCRYLSRLQDVKMSDSFVTRTVKFILQQYPV